MLIFKNNLTNWATSILWGVILKNEESCDYNLQSNQIQATIVLKKMPQIMVKILFCYIQAQYQFFVIIMLPTALKEICLYSQIHYFFISISNN